MTGFRPGSPNLVCSVVYCLVKDSIFLGINFSRGSLGMCMTAPWCVIYLAYVVLQGYRLLREVLWSLSRYRLSLILLGMPDVKDRSL